MFEELLPKGAVFVPNQILFDRSLSVGSKTTWMQLRALAGEDGETPMMSISALCEITGKSRTTIYDHISQLAELDFLQWQPYGRGRLSVRFVPDFAEEQRVEKSEKSDNLSGNPDVNSLKLKDIALRKDLKANTQAVNKELRVRKSGQSVRETGQAQVQEQESGQAPEEKTPAQVYREVMHLSPNRVQREEIDRLVRDLDLWHRTLKYWMLHNWNPFNLPGLLDLYQQGGPQKSRSFDRTDAGEESSFEKDNEQRERNRSEALRIIAHAREKRRAREAEESSLGD